MMITGAATVTDAATQLLGKTASVFTITLGKEGTLLGRGDETALIASIPVVPVDTTGAGDAFVGAILYQLSTRTKTDIGDLSMIDWQQLVQNANKAGARTCEYMGAMEAFRHLNSQIFK